MIAKCACQNCRSTIEFHAADFAEQSRTSTQVIGQYIRCPHCGFATPLTMSLAKWAKVSSTEPVQMSGTVLAVLALVMALIPAVIVVALVKSGVTIHQIMTGGAGIPGTVAMGIAGALALIQAIMWLIFPWLVCWRLSKIRAELRRIERDIRGKQSVEAAR
jgi:uncharacterized membrane protein/DNA-directed RNA polymerase subunit RPC12/RpoP